MTLASDDGGALPEGNEECTPTMVWRLSCMTLGSADEH